MIRKVFVAIAGIFLTFTLPAQEKLSGIGEKNWVDSVYESLSPEQRVGQLFMAAAYSNRSSSYSNDLVDLVKNYHIGGILFMQGGPGRQLHLTKRLQAAANIPLLVGMDLEWGLGMRLDSTMSFSKNMTLGALQNDSLIYAMGTEIARQMKILGVQVNFAPVADIHNNPKNPVIGVRSFSENKTVVARKAVALAAGLQDHGIIAVAKHFPGHGDTDQDSHFTLPVVNHNRQRLDTIEAVPFKWLIAKGIKGIMTGHLIVPGLESDRNLPASLSPAVNQDYLRKDLNFDGLIFTDALNMKAVSDHFSNGQAELTAFRAGADVLLFSENIPAAAKLILQETKDRRSAQKQLENSVKKILAAKYQTGLTHLPRLNEDNLTTRLNSPEADVLALEISKKSITIIHNDADVIPFRILDKKSFAFMEFGDTGHLYNHLMHYGKVTSFDAAHPELLEDRISEYESVIIGISGKEALPGQQLLERLKKWTAKTHIVICYLGNPYDMNKLTEFGSLLCSYENTTASQLATAEVLFGSIGASGRLPVSIDKKTRSGQGITTSSLHRLSYNHPEAAHMDSRILQKIDGLAAEAIHEHATPGCQVLVARNGKVVFSRSYGYYTYDSVKAVSNQTIYDLASVTKVMATTQAIMFLEERGLIDLDKKVSAYLPELKGTNKENLIFRDILTHQAGLWPYLPFWRQTLDDQFNYLPQYYTTEERPEYTMKVREHLYASPAVKDSIWHWVVESKLRPKVSHTPFDYKYSDIGYYIMQHLIERLLNQGLDEFLQQNLYDPLGMTTTGYNPLKRHPSVMIAPTEKDNIFRKALVLGMVHDQGAALFGGVAGHAGLFSNADDLAKLLQMMLQGGEYGGLRFYQPATIEKFTEQQYNSNRRGLGWDKPLPGEYYGPTSQYASPSTFGHTGFTGTAIWADPEFNLIYVFLSNRIYPDASNTKLLKSNIRTRIQDVIYESMWEYQSTHQVN